MQEVHKRLGFFILFFILHKWIAEIEYDFIFV